MRIQLKTLWPWALGAVFILFLALLPVLAIYIPGIFPGPSYTPGTLQLLASALVFAAVALSYNLLLGSAGLLSFGHALYFGAGAYGLGVILRNTGLSFWPAIFIVVIGVLLLAVATGAVSLRVTGIPFAMVTLAFAQAGSVWVRRNASVTGGEEGLSLNVTNVPDQLVGVVNMKYMYWLALALVVLVYAVVLWVDKSRVGHIAAATRENELRVNVLGLPPFKAKLLLFALAGVLAGLSGIVYMVVQSGTVPRSVSADFTITVLVMVVLGGVGSRWGVIIGAIVYTLLNQRLTLLAQADFVEGLPGILRIPLSEPMFILGVMFILVVMFFPGGIAGAVQSIPRRKKPAKRSVKEPDSPLTTEEVTDERQYSHTG
ncbi:MAG TPA: branched-chain amino acid ABC transporter permease [Enteractinococcus sp.]